MWMADYIDKMRPFLRHTNGSDNRTKAVSFSMLEIVVGCFQWKRIVPVFISIVVGIVTQTHTHTVYKHYDEWEQNEWWKLKTLTFMVLLFVSCSLPHPNKSFLLNHILNTVIIHFVCRHYHFANGKYNDGSIHKSLQNWCIAWFMYIIGKFWIRFYQINDISYFNLMENFHWLLDLNFHGLVSSWLLSIDEPKFVTFNTYKFDYLISPKVIKMKSIFGVQILFSILIKTFYQKFSFKRAILFRKWWRKLDWSNNYYL